MNAINLLLSETTSTVAAPASLVVLHGSPTADGRLLVWGETDQPVNWKPAPRGRWPRVIAARPHPYAAGTLMLRRLCGPGARAAVAEMLFESVRLMPVPAVASGRDQPKGTMRDLGWNVPVVFVTPDAVEGVARRLLQRAPLSAELYTLLHAVIHTASSGAVPAHDAASSALLAGVLATTTHQLSAPLLRVRLAPGDDVAVDPWTIQLLGGDADDASVTEMPVSTWLHRHDAARLGDLVGTLAATWPAGGYGGDDPTFEVSVGEVAALLEVRARLETKRIFVELPHWLVAAEPKLRVHVERAATEAVTSLQSICGVKWLAMVDGVECAMSSMTTAGFVDLGDGRWKHVGRNEAKRVRALLRKETLTVAEAHAMANGVGDTAGDDIEVEISDAVLADLLADAETSRRPFVQPATMPVLLKPHQLHAAGFLQHLTDRTVSALLCDEMGLGKTATTLAMLEAKRLAGAAAGGGTKALVLMARPVLLENWVREAKMFAPQLRVAVYYGTNANDASLVGVFADTDVVISTTRTFIKSALITGHRWQSVIVDEAQDLRNSESHGWKHVRALHSDHRVLMTGTPIENTMMDIWALSELANPGLLGSKAGFRRQFAAPLDRINRAHAEGRETDMATAEKLAGQLQAVLSPVVLRRTLESAGVLKDLPVRTDSTVSVGLTAEQNRLYQAEVSALDVASRSAKAGQDPGMMIRAMGRMQRICGHPEAFAPSGGRIAGRSFKVDRLVEELREIFERGEKVVVFSSSRKLIELINGHLIEMFPGVSAEMIHGGVNGTVRSKVVGRFQNAEGAGVLVATKKTAGAGLTLTAANTVIHLDRWWNPAVEDQASARVHRMGQTKPVRVVYYTVTGTIEDHICGVEGGKRHTASMFLSPMIDGAAAALEKAVAFIGGSTLDLLPRETA